MIMNSSNSKSIQPYTVEATTWRGFSTVFIPDGITREDAMALKDKINRAINSGHSVSNQADCHTLTSSNIGVVELRQCSSINDLRVGEIYVWRTYSNYWGKYLYRVYLGTGEGSTQIMHYEVHDDKLVYYNNYEGLDDVYPMLRAIWQRVTNNIEKVFKLIKESNE